MILMTEVKKSFVLLLFKIKKADMRLGWKNMTTGELNSTALCYKQVKKRSRTMGKKEGKYKNTKRKNHEDHLIQHIPVCPAFRYK